MSAQVERRLRGRCTAAVGIAASATALVGLCVSTSLARAPMTAIAAALRTIDRAGALLRPRSGGSRMAGVCGFLTSLLISCITGAALVWSWSPRPFIDRCEGDEICIGEGGFVLILLGAWSAVLNFIRDEPRIRFPVVRRGIYHRLKSAAVPAAAEALKKSILIIIIFPLAYTWKGRSLCDSIASALRVGVERVTFNTGLLWDTWTACVLFNWSCEMCAASLDALLSEGTPTGDAPTVIAEELRCPSVPRREIAARELDGSIRDDSAFRMETFRLSEPGGHPANWRALRDACLSTIDSLSDEIDGRTRNNVPVEVRPVETESPRLRPLSPDFRSPRTHPNLLVPPQEKILIKEPEDTKAKRTVLSGNAAAAAAAASAISRLTAASLIEDKYGIVQDDTPAVLNSLLRLKRSLDRLGRANSLNRKSPKRDADASRSFAELRSAIKRSIYRITVAYGDHIEGFQLDGESQATLRPFIEMREC